MRLSWKQMSLHRDRGFESLPLRHLLFYRSMVKHSYPKRKNVTKILITLACLLCFNYLVIYADQFQVILDSSGVKANFVDTTSTQWAPSTAIALDNVIIDDSQHNWNITYVIKQGDTLVTIAQEVGTTVDNIKRVNNLAGDVDVKNWTIVNKDGIAVGRLTISELPGIVIAMENQTSVSEFAKHYNLNVEDIKSLNNIADAKTILRKGDELFLTMTEKDAIKKWILEDPNPAPEPTKPTQTTIAKNTTKPSTTSKPSVVSNSTKTTQNTNTATSKPVAQIVSTSTSTIEYNKGTILASRFQKDGGYAGFAAGNCTSYAASRRPDIFNNADRTFRGNANAWYANAAEAWNKVGKTPKVGAIIVFTPWVDASGYGHVGIVEKVDGDKLVISDMNYKGRYIVTKRVVSTSGILWYIY